MTYILNLPVNPILSENLELVRKIVYKFYIKNIYISIRAKKTYVTLYRSINFNSAQFCLGRVKVSMNHLIL
jgi:hypothetical protein